MTEPSVVEMFAQLFVTSRGIEKCFSDNPESTEGEWGLGKVWGQLSSREMICEPTDV